MEFDMCLQRHNLICYMITFIQICFYCSNWLAYIDTTVPQIYLMVCGTSLGTKTHKSGGKPL